MRYFMLFTSIFYITTTSYSQSRDLKTYPSGLIYSDETMRQLDVIVDSLNTKFLNCELNKTFYSQTHGKAHYISMKKGAKSKAKIDIDNNISFEDFVNKYSTAEITENLLLLRHEYKNYNDENVIKYSNVALTGRYGNSIKFYGEDLPKIVKKGSWVVQYEISDDKLRAFYLVEDLVNEALIEKYARMIQYSDCMVDTNSQIFTEKADGGARWEEKSEVKVEEFLKYATANPTNRENDEKFNKLLKEAITEAKENGGSQDEFEVYVATYASKEVALELKRNRKVYGFCSMDTRPREHAQEIAQLSAETAHWETFLRSHLDIMNDRFERAASSSYGEASFHTYIGELEALDINVPDLMLGISLRIENPSQNHYYGAIYRVGRALAETKYANEIEANMLAMIADENLDDYNRVVIYFLFENYNYNLKSEVQKSANSIKLNEAVSKLPKYIADQINAKEE